MQDFENIKLGPNYIKLINWFWLKDIEAGFSHLEVHLYFKLLEINNRLGWKRTFKYPNSRLESEIGTRAKNLIAARQKLIKWNLISYENGTTREAGVYSLLSDVVTKESNQESNEESNQGNNLKNNFPDCEQTEEQKKAIRGTLTKQDEIKQDEYITPNPKEDSPSDKINFQKLVEVYHGLCPNLPKVESFSKKRKAAVKARIGDHGKEKVMRVLKLAGESEFLSGDNDRNWKANFDWIFKPENFIKILEGSYQSKGTKGRKFRNSDVKQYDDKL